MTQSGDLSRPPWFEDLAAWWVPAATEGAAPHLEPLGLDSRNALHVSCDSPAWHIQTRLLAPAILKRLALVLPDVGIGALVLSLSTTVTPAAAAAWHELLGPDLAQRVKPFCRRERELWVIAGSAEARDALEQHFEQHTDALADFLAGYGFTLWRCTFEPVMVAVVSAPGFPDLDLVGNVLLETWHDATQEPGPEHPLLLTYGERTEVDRYVDDWVNQHTNPDPMTSRVWGSPSTLTDFERAPASHLCLAFGLHRGPKDFLHMQLRDGTTWSGVPVRRWDR